MISSKPCGATVQAPPNYDVCGDCQGIRALCGVSPCPHTPPFESRSRSSRASGMFDEGAFTTWLEAGGRKPSTANNFTTAARNAVRAGARSPDDVTPTLFPDLKEATIEKYRHAMGYLAAWERGDEPLPLQRYRKKSDPGVMTKKQPVENCLTLPQQHERLVTMVVDDTLPVPNPEPIVEPVPEPAVAAEMDDREPTITLNIPVAWVESVVVDRRGYRIAIDVIDDPWLPVGEEIFRRAVEVLKTETRR